VKLPERNTGEFTSTEVAVTAVDRGALLNEYMHDITISTKDSLVHMELGEQEMREFAYSFAAAYLNKEQLKKLIVRLEAMECGFNSHFVDQGPSLY